MDPTRDIPQSQNTNVTDLEFELVDIGPGYKPESGFTNVGCFCGVGCLCGIGCFAEGAEKPIG